jgi:hypothetical protein
MTFSRSICTNNDARDSRMGCSDGRNGGQSKSEMSEFIQRHAMGTGNVRRVGEVCNHCTCQTRVHAHTFLHVSNLLRRLDEDPRQVNAPQLTVKCGGSSVF